MLKGKKSLILSERATARGRRCARKAVKYNEEPDSEEEMALAKARSAPPAEPSGNPADAPAPPDGDEPPAVECRPSPAKKAKGSDEEYKAEESAAEDSDFDEKEEEEEEEDFMEEDEEGSDE